MAPNTVKVSFDVGKLKGPSMLMPAPPEFLQDIARIILLWGQFEVLYDGFIEALLKNNNTILMYNWRKINFKKRKSLFFDETRKCFGVSGGIINYFRRLNDDASRLHVARNALVHGLISLHIKDDETVLFTTIKNNGKDIALKFDESKVESLYYDMMFLAGRLNTFNRPPDFKNFVVPELTWQEREALQIFLQNNLQTPAIPPTSGRQRPPSRPLPQSEG